MQAVTALKSCENNPYMSMLRPSTENSVFAGSCAAIPKTKPGAGPKPKPAPKAKAEIGAILMTSVEVDVWTVACFVLYVLLGLTSSPN